MYFNEEVKVMNYGCTNQGKIIRMRDSMVKYSLLRMHPIKEIPDGMQFLATEDNNIYEEVCMFSEKESKYTYFKSSKLLSLHNIEFMVTVLRKDKKSVKIKLFFNNAEDKKSVLTVKEFTLTNLPFEVKREYFIAETEDTDTVYKNMWNRISYEHQTTQKRLNGMNLF